MILNSISTLSLNPIAKFGFEDLLSKNKSDFIEKLKISKNEIILMSDQVFSVLCHADLQKNHVTEWENIRTVWNVSGFILSASLDLKTYLEILCTLDDNIQRISIIRIVFTQLYEIIQDLDCLTNRNFTDAMEKIGAGELKRELYDKRKKLKTLGDKYKDDLHNVRINVGAHRQKDYKVFHEFICNLEYTSCMRLIAIFGDAINDLADTIQKVMVKSVNFIKNL